MLLFQVTVPDSDIYGVTLAVGEKRWLPFTIEIPPNIVSPMVVSNKKERAIAMVKYTVCSSQQRLVPALYVITLKFEIPQLANFNPK